ncbi:MAG: trimeric intracellular cation channel family protein [Chitinophagaceae bacterium]|nr:trimeric intracellular cation channel family protein [Chitinophagaceae bacterium]
MSFLQVITYAGIFIFAISGAMKARSFKMDVFGGLVIAFITAYGGGTLRDLLIGVRPVNWINDNLALGLVFGGTALTFLLKENVRRFRRTIFYTDAFGLGLFTVWGIEVALANGLNEVYALAMGVITATFGGLIADILCNSVPHLLRKGELYATACAIGGTGYLLLQQFPLQYQTNLSICVLIVAGVRIYAMRKRLTLPEI